MEEDSVGPVRVVETEWEARRDELWEIRRRVFVDEQGVPVDIELDGRDPSCRHFLALDREGRPVGAARLEATGKLGRMAVLPDARRLGVGSALLEAALGRAREWGVPVVLHAQESAIGFYQRHGFVVDGPRFDEAGIPHRAMRRA